MSLAKSQTKEQETKKLCVPSDEEEDDNIIIELNDQLLEKIHGPSLSDNPEELL